jgi:hypothetical protein
LNFSSSAAVATFTASPAIMSGPLCALAGSTNCVLISMIRPSFDTITRLRFQTGTPSITCSKSTVRLSPVDSTPTMRISVAEGM